MSSQATSASYRAGRRVGGLWSAAMFVTLPAGCEAPPRAPAADVQSAREATVLIRDVHVLSMVADAELPSSLATVAIAGARIVAIDTTNTLAPAADTNPTIIEGNGGYLIPGLVDFHVHIRDESELLSYVAWGVTTVINMRGSASHIAMRDAIAGGEVIGPRVYTAGPLVDGEPPVWSGAGTVVVTDSADAAAVVDRHSREGFDFIKVYNNLSPAVLRAISFEAERRGMPVVGHLPRRPRRDRSLQVAIAAGIDLIAHGEEYFFTYFGGAGDAEAGVAPRAPDASLIPAAAELTAAAGVAVTPNLSFIEATRRQLDDLDAVLADSEAAYLADDVLTMWRRSNPTTRPDLQAFAQREAIKQPFTRLLTRGLHDANVLLLAGTDASAPGLFPGRSLHLELRELERAGLEPVAALAAATRNAGAFARQHFDPPAPFGIIEVGARADLVLVRENPLEGMDALSSIEGVILAGRWMTIEQIHAMRKP